MRIRTREEVEALSTGAVIIERQRAIIAIDEVESHYGEETDEHPYKEEARRLEGYVIGIEKVLTSRGLIAGVGPFRTRRAILEQKRENDAFRNPDGGEPYSGVHVYPVNEKGEVSVEPNPADRPDRRLHYVVEAYGEDAGHQNYVDVLVLRDGTKVVISSGLASKRGYEIGVYAPGDWEDSGEAEDNASAIRGEFEKKATS